MAELLFVFLQSLQFISLQQILINEEMTGTLKEKNGVILT